MLRVRTRTVRIRPFFGGWSPWRALYLRPEAPVEAWGLLSQRLAAPVQAGHVSRPPVLAVGGAAFSSMLQLDLELCVLSAFPF